MGLMEELQAQGKPGINTAVAVFLPVQDKIEFTLQVALRHRQRNQAAAGKRFF